MLPFKKILAAVQVDSDSTPVVDLAGALAAASGAELELIHVFETTGYGGPRNLVWEDGKVLSPEGDPGPWRSAQAMARMLQRLGPLGLPALRASMAYGVVENTLADRISQGGFGLLILGHHAHSRLEGMLAGDVAQELLRICPCPLLVLPHG